MMPCSRRAGGMVVTVLTLTGTASGAAAGESDGIAFGHPGDAPTYELSAVRQGFRPVPRLTRTGLPPVLPFIRDVERRKRIFLKSVLPAVLKANARVRAQRSFLRTVSHVNMRRGFMPGAWRARLRRLEDRYHVEHGNLPTLLRRVNTLPPSLMLAQAALETGWGTSRFAQLGNALFGEHVTDPAVPGMIPGGFDGEAPFKVRAFPTLTAAVSAYLHNINTTAAYAGLRAARADAVRNGRQPDSIRLAGHLTAYSVRGQAYVEDVRVTIRANDLRDFDDVWLAPTNDGARGGAYACAGTPQASSAAC